jgi:ribosomal-protein-alanine N-acetyltransferase
MALSDVAPKIEPEIRTARLRLRRALPDDLQAMHAILSDPRAMRYWSSLPHTDIAQTREWLDGMIASPPEESDDFIVVLDGAVIGKAGCWRLPAVGYILHPDYWGQGFATEALTAAIAHVFANFPLPALIADVDPRNASSLALLARLGFKEIQRASRTWQIGEEWCDSIYLGLPRPSA